jgi:hypothetical protein
MHTRAIVRGLVVCLTVLCLHLAVAVKMYSQAWLPPKGEGQVSVTYENIFVRYHLNFTGARTDRGPIRTHTTILSFEYGLTNKLALDADLAHVFSKYEGFVGPVLHGPVDNGSYHPAFQDARLTLRYNALNRRTVVTPFIGVAIPTHHYETRGHSAVGRGLRELLIGVNVGRELESRYGGSYAHVRYSYAIVPRVAGFNLNRSNADWEVGHFATSRLSLRFLAAWQRTQEGLNHPLDNILPNYEEFHDRAARANFIRLGGGATFAVSRSLDLHVDYISTVSGINTHAARGITVGISRRFSRGFNTGQFSAQNSQAKLSGVGRLVY